jgi:cytochrome c-type biogenesis protein CcmH/NrfF
LLQDRSSQVKKITPRVRCPNATTQSLEDSHANRMLQLANAPAQRRLLN